MKLEIKEILVHDLKTNVLSNCHKSIEIIFLHNAATSHEVWLNQVDFFSKTYKVAAIDLWGFGLSQRVKEEMTIQKYVSLLGALIDNIGAPQVILIGNCLGSRIAIDYAKVHPNRVSKLIVFNELSTSNLLMTKWRKFISLSSRSSTFKKLIYTYGKNFSLPKIIRDLLVKDYVFNIDALGQLRVKFSDSLKSKSALTTLIDSSLDLMNNKKERVNLDSKISVLSIWGRENKVLSKYNSIDHHGAYKEVVIKEGGHLCMMEKPELINPLLEDFINS